MQAGKVYVTTSWDDGHELDLRLASELAAHGMAGTFYVAPDAARYRRPSALVPAPCASWPRDTRSVPTP